MILGITGMDGSYLSELLLDNQYKVFGMLRRSSSFNTSRIDQIRDKISLHYGDLTDLNSIINILKTIMEKNIVKYPIEIYNLAAQSHVQVSFQIENYTTNCDAIGTLNVLQAIKILDLMDKVKLYQASTSEMYGNSIHSLNVSENQMLNETSKMEPVSPYAISKLYSYHMMKYYREAYKIFAVNGILFNHTSPRRGDNFVCKKITNYVKQLDKKALLTRFINLVPLRLGNLNSTRDFGHAKDYVRGMFMMMQQSTPDDYVLATGRSVSIREFVQKAFSVIGVDIEWRGKGKDEKGYLKGTQTVVVEVDERYYRPYELMDLLGDSSKARNTLGWTPKYELEELIKEMIEKDC